MMTKGEDHGIRFGLHASDIYAGQKFRSNTSVWLINFLQMIVKVYIYSYTMYKYKKYMKINETKKF